MLTIRRYVAQDADATIEIFLRSIREVASKDYSPDEIHAWAQVEDREAWAMRRASRPTWIVLVAGCPAGFSDLEPSGHLDMMFVHPRYQRLGIASLLLETVEAAAQEQSLPVITTEASLTARGFFARKGFEVMAAQKVEKRGRKLKNFAMTKRLMGIVERAGPLP